MSLQKFLDEISQVPDEICTPFIIYPQEEASIEIKVEYLFRQLLREKRSNNKNMMVFYAYRIGKLIEEETQSLTTRMICLQKLTLYYRKAVVRCFYIFEGR